VAVSAAGSPYNNEVGLIASPTVVVSTTLRAVVAVEAP
jgi:hypothetical protein